MKHSDILVIIPCYNEQENIERVVSHLTEVCPTVDYLVINDCSTDGSEAILRKNGYNHVSLPVNLGIGGGVQTGYRYARENGYAIAVQMDGDGQHDPAFLETVIAPVKAGTLDMCIGSRFVTKEGFQSSALRRFGINFLSGLIFLLSGKRVLDVTSGFRATNRAMIDFFSEHYAADYPEPEAILAATLRGFRVGEAPVIMRERMGGVSSIRSFKSAYFMIKVSLSLLVDRISIRRTRKAEKEAAK